MTELENIEDLSNKLEEIKNVLSEMKSEIMSSGDCNDQFYGVMQVLDKIASDVNLITNEKSTPTNEYTILQTNILEVKKELSAMNTSIDDTINTKLGELIIKLTEKINRLEILTNNSGIDQTLVLDAHNKLEDNIKDDMSKCTEYLENSMKLMGKNMSEQFSEEMSLLSSNVEKTNDNLKRSLIDIFTKIQEMVCGHNFNEKSETNNNINENLEMLKTGIYNLNINTEQRFTKLNSIIEDSDLFAKLQNFANIKDLPALGELKTVLISGLNNVVEEYIPQIKNIKNDEELSLCRQEFQNKIYNVILTMLENVSEFISCESTNNLSGSNNSAIKELRNSIDEVRSKLELTKEKDSELAEVIKECAHSIIENSEPDRVLIKELLADIKKNISVLQSGDEETDYTYSMQDIESDIAKIRIYLNELAHNGITSDLEDFSSELNGIVIMVDSIKQQLNKIDECDITNTVEKIQDDITSMSSRINRLLLTSDNSYNMVECTLKEFKLLSDEISSKITSLSDINKFKNIENELNSIKTVLNESNNYNSVINQSLIMLAEWVDSAGEMLTNISEKQNKLGAVEELQSLLNNIKSSVGESSFDVINKITDISNETNNLINNLKPVDYSENLMMIENKLTEQKLLIEQQEERLNKLDEKFNTIIEISAKNDSTQFASKLDDIYEKMEKLNNNIEKITSFINED